MRVMHLLSSSGFYGAEAMALQLSVAQRRAGLDVSVGFFEHGNGAGEQLAARFSAAAVPAAVLTCRGRFDFAVLRKLRRHVGATSASLIHTHNYKASFFAHLAFLQAPIVTTYHNWMLQDPKLRWYATIDKQLARYAAACVAVSSDVRSELLRHAPARRVHQIPNGIDVVQWSPDPNDGQLRRELGLEGAWIVGFVGRLSAEKGASLLLEALAEVPNVGGRDLHLLVAGDGPDGEALRGQAQALGIASRVHWLGSVADPRPVYAAMSLIVLPSVTEGLPMTLLESMACERAAIATRVGEMPSVIEGSGGGWMMRERTRDELASVLREALSDGRLLSEKGRVARDYVLRRHSSDAMAAAYEAVYRALVNGSGGSAAALPRH